MEFFTNFQTWFQEQAGAAFAIVVGAVAIWFMVKRKWAEFIGFAVLALVVAVFVFAPDLVKNLGIDMFTKFLE